MDGSQPIRRNVFRTWWSTRDHAIPALAIQVLVVVGLWLLSAESDQALSTGTAAFSLGAAALVVATAIHELARRRPERSNPAIAIAVGLLVGAGVLAARVVAAGVVTDEIYVLGTTISVIVTISAVERERNRAEQDLRQTMVRMQTDAVERSHHSAHEARNALTALGGAVHTLFTYRDQLPDDTQERLVTGVSNQLERLDALFVEEASKTAS